MAKPKPTSQPKPKLSSKSTPRDSASTSALQISGGGSGGQALTKEQKRFNTLVKKIKAARARLERLIETDQELRSLGQKIIMPAEEIYMRALRDLVLAMHASPHHKKLTKRQKVKFREVMNLEITLLLDTIYFTEDEELRTLFSSYSAISYEEMEEQQAKAEREAAKDIFGMFGMDIESEDMGDPAKLFEKVHAALEGAPPEDETARQGARKKTKAQLNAESKRQAAQDAVKKTTRQIYLDLVKHYHPDREQDELKRAEKTEWMKKITAAYDADDHLRLLEMQMTLLTERENAFAEFKDGELRYFNESLQQQLAQLENEMMMAHPLHSGNLFGNLYHPNRTIMLRELETEKSSLQHRTNAVARDAQLITSEQGFRRYIADYALPSRHALMLDDFEGFFS